MHGRRLQAAAAAKAFTRASGPGITPYETLTSQGSLSTTANSVSPAAQLSFLAGTYEFYDFNEAGNVYGMLLWHSILGVRGSGVNRTIFQMHPNSSTKAASVPPQSTFPTGTNPLHLMRIDQSPVLSDFSLLATDQGHLYNGLQLYQTTSATMSNVLIKGIPGDNSANPGETFFVNMYQNSNTTMNSVEIDGKNASGTKVGASGIGINFGSNNIFNDLYVHDLQYGHAVAAYTTSNITFNRPKIMGNPDGLNFERTSGTVNINNAYFRNNLDGNGNINFHVLIANDQSSGTFNINDPDFDGPKLKVRVTGYMGNPRTQNSASVRLFIGGIERADLMDMTIQ